MAADTRALLEALLDADVEFVVVGGTAALVHGAATPTDDLDVAAPLTVENIERLLSALRPLRPRHVTRPDLGEVWQTPEELSRFRLLLLETDLGRLDVLAEIEPLGGIGDLQTINVELVPNRPVRVLSLDQLIQVKAHLGRPKDKIVEAELRAIRDLLLGDG